MTYGSSRTISTVTILTYSKSHVNVVSIDEDAGHPLSEANTCFASVAPLKFGASDKAC